MLDGLAVKQILGTKGDRGTRMCYKCPTLFAESSDIVQDDGGDGLVCSTHDYATLRLNQATDATVHGTIDRLTAHKLTCTIAGTPRAREVFKVREQTAGFNHLPHGLLQNLRLRDVVKPVTHMLCEPAHTLHISGVCNTVIFLVLEAVYQSGVPRFFARLRAFFR